MLGPTSATLVCFFGTVRGGTRDVHHGYRLRPVIKRFRSSLVASGQMLASKGPVDAEMLPCSRAYDR
jgi:hypothetical protein